MSSRFKEYSNYDAIGLAELVRKGAVGPNELLREAQRGCPEFCVNGG